MLDMAQARTAMTGRQIEDRGVRSPRVLEAMRSVPREIFVAAGMKTQLLSEPHIVGLMIQAMDLGPLDRVLQLGVGSGYATAVISRLAREVFAIERHDALTRLARERLAGLAYGNIALRTGDGTRGWSAAAPFDAIVATDAAPAVPQTLKEQLDLGGRLAMPVGDPGAYRLIKVTRRDANHFEEEDLGALVPAPRTGEADDRPPESLRPAEARSFRLPDQRRPPD